jgi:predicted transposase YbfD/YdcC
MRNVKHPQISLFEHFQNLQDPRVNRTKRHDLLDVMIISVCTLLCGGETYNDMEDFGKAKEDWFKTFLKLPNGIPSHDTFNRVFAALDPNKFLDCFLEWTQAMREVVDKEIVALDGKALRSALNKDDQLKYVVSAWAESNNMVLGQIKVADKSNEITAIPKLLRVLELSGCIVTIDAMGCQKKIAKEVIEADADYVFSLKGNQETVHREVQSFMDACIDDSKANQLPRNEKLKLDQHFRHCETVDGDHGRIEIRRYYQSDDLAWFEDLDKWEGLRSVGVVESVREIGDEVTTERRYFLSSLPLDVETMARAIRGHWGIENKLHWVLDVCFREDYSRVRSGHAAENLASLRRLALNLLKKEKTKKRGIKGKQLNASWNHAYLLKLLGI